MTHAPLILASGSRYKRELMARLSLPFTTHSPDIDETPLPGESASATALRLAAQKARAIAALHPEAYVIGCDQVIALDDTLLHKPGDEERARAQLRRLQGREHALLCAVALCSPRGGEPLTALAQVTMVMRPLDEAQIAAYVARDMPLDCAGAYKLEEAGVRLFSRMQGDDYTAIVGLPLTRVMDLLEQAGYPLIATWL